MASLSQHARSARQLLHVSSTSLLVEISTILMSIAEHLLKVERRSAMKAESTRPLKLVVNRLQNLNAVCVEIADTQPELKHG